ncbi:MAG TPA: helix-turn-helix transcriptional regulator [Solirubrobacteraceae bacterium]|jgi:transcriptional regulator with XRE-family HTH domain
MKLSEMKTSDEVLTEALRDPAYAAEWNRTTVARAVALKVLAYRAEHGLSQRSLAKRLGMSQPQVARLEIGEHNPTIDTLARLAQGLDIEFAIDVNPFKREPRLVSKEAQTDHAVATYQAHNATVLLAAS